MKQIDSTYMLLISYLDHEPATIQRLATWLGVTERRVRQLIRPLFKEGRVFRTLDKPPKYGRRK